MISPMDILLIAITILVALVCTFAYLILNKPHKKYIMVPDADGSYKLKRYEGLTGYMYVATVRDTEEADQIIKNLERDCIYYTKEKDS
jgi:hypothetical protein